MVTYGKTQTMLHFDGTITKIHVFADVPDSVDARIYF